MKQVIYNGGTLSYYGCSDPSILTVGKVYNVVNARDRGWQTDYTLEGEKYKCCKLDVEVVNRTEVKTSTVQSVAVIGKNTYKVTTRNSVYVVQLVK